MTPAAARPAPAASPAAHPASFRDPAGQVFRRGDEVLRAVSAAGAADFEFARDSGLLGELAESGRLVAHEVVAADATAAALLPPGEHGAAGWRYVLRHPPLPFVSYPYEWSFAALKAAALLHLEVHLEALERGVTLADASAYNVQFVGARPVFIDTLSFRRYREGEYWTGHRQFVEQFLNPLLLRARLGVPHNDWYRGAIEGIPSDRLLRLLPLRHKLSWSMLSNLVLPVRLERSARRGRAAVSRDTLRLVPLPRDALRRMLKRLQAWIGQLAPADCETTTWQDYSRDNTYGSAEAAAKRELVAAYAAAERPGLLWDLGCNTGDYAAAALEAGAGYAVGWDIDHGALEAAYGRAAATGLAFTPLYFDAGNPAPDQGWAGAERSGMAGRGPADGVLALAFVHHLALARNVPLPRIVDWLIALAPAGIVEFVGKDDPTVEVMLRLREDVFPGYTREAFLDLLGSRARIEQIVNLGTRDLVRYGRLR